MKVASEKVKRQNRGLDEDEQNFAQQKSVFKTLKSKERDRSLSL